MVNDIPPTPVAELIANGILAINDGYRAKNVELSRSGIPFARAQNINQGFKFDDADCFPEENLGRVEHKTSMPGDVVFTSKGTVGRFALVTAKTPRFVYAPQLCFWRSLRPNELHPRWLYYWMHSREFYVQFKGVASQTDMADYVSLGDQRRMRLTLPPIQDQRAIAHVLGTLDDKIELNRRMNDTLEGIAGAIFKSWFVDFDPVRAKAEGRDPGLPKPIADLFPDRFAESAIGPIPNGWTVQPIGDVVRCIGGGTPSTKEPAYWDGPIRFATPRDMASLSAPVLLATERGITQAGLERVSSGLLPRGTLLLSSRAPIGYLAIVEIPVAVNQGFIAMDCNGPLPNHYVLHWVRANMDVIIGNANGTTFLEISKKNFRPLPAIVPPREVIQEFVRLASPMHNQVVTNLIASRTLCGIRDALLPKLLSGEVRLDGVFHGGAT